MLKTTVNIPTCIKIIDALKYINMPTKINASYLQEKKIFANFEMVNIWKKSKCTISNYVKLYIY